MFKKLKENKFLKILWNVVYTLLFIFVVLVLLVVALQRFSNNTITLGGFRIFNILTGSMRPVYEVGDILVTKEIEPSKIKVDDDVTYLGKEGDFAGKTVTHRVTSITKGEDGKYKFTTKGTANELEDPQISEEQIQGKVVYKFITLSFISKIVNNLYSMYFIIFIPVAIIIFVNLRRIYLDIVSRDEEDDDDEDDDDDDDDEEDDSKDEKSNEDDKDEEDNEDNDNKNHEYKDGEKKNK